MSITHLYNKIIFAALRKKIKKNPYIGQAQNDGTHLYTKGGYSINYRKSILPGGQLCIEWVSHKRRLSPYEEKIRRTKKGFFDFWYYQKWVVFFRPSILLILVVSIFLFYSEVMETQETKMARLKWMIASVVGINPKEVQYIGVGWLEISGQRKKGADRINEPIRWTFNPFRWLFFSEGGFLTRWRGEPYGYATHPLVYNEGGDVWMNKNGTWEHGRIVGENLEWDRPVGSAKVTEQEILSREDKKLRVIDK